MKLKGKSANINVNELFNQLSNNWVECLREFGSSPNLMMGGHRIVSKVLIQKLDLYHRICNKHQLDMYQL